jgi:hypothetical protein
MTYTLSIHNPDGTTLSQTTVEKMEDAFYLAGTMPDMHVTIDNDEGERLADILPLTIEPDALHRIIMEFVGE